jgi:hypothetical protein
MSLHGRPGLIVFCVTAAGVALAGCSGSTAGAERGAATSGGRAPSGAGSIHSAAVASPASSATAGGGLTRVASSPGRVGEAVTPAAPLVVRDGTVTLRVPPGHVVDAFNSLSSAAESLGGYVASSSGTGAGDARGASIVVRVPSSRFETLVGRVDKLGKVEAQSQSGHDVTAESVNLSARIANLKAEETSLRTLLSRAGSIAAILQVQDQLFGVEGDVEQLSAEEGSLIDQATFATLTAELSPRAAPVRRPAKGRENSFVRAVKLAAHNTAVAARGVVLAVGWAFPLLLLGAVLFCAWWARRRMTRRRPPAASAPGVS